MTSSPFAFWIFLLIFLLTYITPSDDLHLFIVLYLIEQFCSISYFSMHYACSFVGASSIGFGLCQGLTFAYCSWPYTSARDPYPDLIRFFLLFALVRFFTAFLGVIESTASVVTYSGSSKLRAKGERDKIIVTANFTFGT